MSSGRKAGLKKIPYTWQEIYSKNVGFYFRNLLFELGKNNIAGIESAAILLNQIKIEKDKLGIKEKQLPIIMEKEFPFKIPDNWVWCRLGEMSINLDGARKPIALSDRENRAKIYDYYGASGVIDKIDGFTHEGELLLIGEDGANLVSRSTPVAYLAKGKFWVNNHAHVLNTVHRITLDYLCGYINSIDLKPFITGGFQPKLSQGNLNLIPVPLPPIGEQEKIISFLNNFEQENTTKSLLYFDENIEKAIYNLQKSQMTGAELKLELKFQLTQLENLNQAILQEAVQGKLVKQDPKDEPASELLKRIKAEKAKSGKKEKPLPPIKLEEIPFDIPESWVWCRLGEISKYVTSGSRDWSKFYNKEGAHFIRSGEIKTNSVVLKDTIKVKLPEKIEGKRSLVEQGDLLTTITGGNVGKCAYIDFLIPESYVSQSVALTKLVDIRIGKFIHYCFQSPIGTSTDLKESVYGIGRPVLSLPQIENLRIPLPPLAEQKRIVSEIEKQLAKTKQLKEHIIANQQATEQLLKALLHQAFLPVPQAGEVEEMVTV
jgi:type I restriction enzyme S subunit